MALFLPQADSMNTAVRRLYRRGGEHIHREIAGEHLLVALKRRESTPLYVLTPVAVAIWDHLASWTSPEDITAALQARYDVTEEEALADVRDFLGQLAAIGAVEVREVE